MRCVRVSHEDLDAPEAVERETVRVSQRLPALGSRNTGRFKKCADLLRMHLTVRDEYALQRQIHSRPLCLDVHADAADTSTTHFGPEAGACCLVSDV